MKYKIRQKIHVKYDLNVIDGVVGICIFWAALCKSWIYLAESFGAICNNIVLSELCMIYCVLYGSM